MKIETITTDKGQIEYSIEGVGIPILFFHGGHSNCKETLFRKGIDTGKFQIIALSRPGYGDTPLADNTTPEKTAELAISLLDYLGIDKVIPYGISAGGLSSIAIASIYPGRVMKLVLASAVSKKWLSEDGETYKNGKKMFNPKTEKLVWGMIRVFSKILPGMIAKSFYPYFSYNDKHTLSKEDVRELMMTFKYFSSKTGFMSDIDQNIPEDMTSRIKCPTLVIHSKNDSSVPFEHAEHSHRTISNSTLIELDNEWGHLFWIGKDSSESINKTIEFMEM